MINDNYLFIDHALAIPSPAALGEVVDCGELNQGGEDKGITHCDEPVHGCGIGDFRQGVTGADTQRGHSQYSGHTWEEYKQLPWQIIQSSIQLRMSEFLQVGIST